MRQDEAIRLAYALVAKAAEAAGVRALAIKGLVADAHGLRPNRTPADVDVLVEPDGFAAFAQQLEEWGWWVRLGEFSDMPVPHHSLTYINDGWPCDIDAHHRFPGFLAPAQQVFDALWERRQPLSTAGRLVPAADWATSVAIAALHSVRSKTEDPRHADELRHLISLSAGWTRGQRSTLAALAQATGSAQSLEAIWERLGVPANPTAEDTQADALAQWRALVDGRETSPRVWLRYLATGDLRQLLTRLRAMLWPPETMMRGTRPIAEGNSALFRARLARIAAALWNLPRNLLATARGGQNVRRDLLNPECPPHPAADPRG